MGLVMSRYNNPVELPAWGFILFFFVLLIGGIFFGMYVQRWDYEKNSYVLSARSDSTYISKEDLTQFRYGYVMGFNRSVGIMNQWVGQVCNKDFSSKYSASSSYSEEVTRVLDSVLKDTSGVSIVHYSSKWLRFPDVNGTVP